MKNSRYNIVAQILKIELNLSNAMCNKFLELADTQSLKKKEMFAEKGKVCYHLGIIEERYKLLLKTYPQVEQHVSQQYIAAYLGIKPESLSRLKSLNIGQ